MGLYFFSAICVALLVNKNLVNDGIKR
jgi:hypothetical protein